MKKTAIDSRRQIHFHFSMRTLSLLITLTCLVLAFAVAFKSITDARERHAVGSFIRRVCDGETIHGVQEPPGFYKWLRQTTGGDYHASITVIKINSRSFNDSAMPLLIEELRVLPKLDELDLRGSSVTAAGVSMLQSEFPRLTVHTR